MRDASIDTNSFFWVLQVLCALHRKPFSIDMVKQQVVPPYTDKALSQAIEAIGFTVGIFHFKPHRIGKEPFPLLVWLHCDKALQPALILEADETQILLFIAGNQQPEVMTVEKFTALYSGNGIRITQKRDSNITASDDPVTQHRKFGFSWFVPELLKHRKLWHEILLASFVIQLIALATPLFTQTIIDKVIVNRTQSTLLAIAIGMAVFMLFSALLTWLRQYLILHTGNRVDAVLGATVFDHLLKLPLVYFQHRPTGVIAARLHGIETIREFISSAAVTLMLDLPFLLIFVAVMFYYSAILTCIVLGILSLIVGLSLVSAPLFQIKLQEQFAQGARNQAF